MGTTRWPGVKIEAEMYEQTIIGPAPVPTPAPADRTLVAPAPRAFVPRTPLVARARPGQPYHWARTPTLVAVHGIDEPIDDSDDDTTTEVFGPAPIRLLYAPMPARRPAPLFGLVLTATALGGLLIALAALL